MRFLRFVSMMFSTVVLLIGFLELLYATNAEGHEALLHGMMGIGFGLGAVVMFSAAAIVDAINGRGP